MSNKEIYKLDRKKGIYLKHTAAKGRGVFCVSDIEEGEIIEMSPAILLDEKETAHADKTILYDYKFKISTFSNSQRVLFHVEDPKKSCCIVMGVMSFCNHSENPNADIFWEEDEGSIYHFLEATRGIPKNTEICTNYGRGWFAKRKQVRK